MNRRGFSLVEVALATVVVGGLAVAVVSGVGSVARSVRSQAERERGVLLASRLMEEIVTAAYDDPQGASGLIGVEPGEKATDRTTLDDVDDYDGLDEEPTTQTGEPIAGAAGWRWKVRVEYADGVTTDRGMKVITVQTIVGDRLVVSLRQVRTRGADAARATTYRTVTVNTPTRVAEVSSP